MGKLAFVFAGQGAQAPGMGRELYEQSSAARAVFDLAERLRPGTRAQCFEGTAQELAQTVNTQPCLYTVDLACGAALTQQGIRPQAAAGFSLGELPALAFGGLYSVEDGFRLVQRRGELMEDCAEKNPGGMAAVLRLTEGQVQELCAAVPGSWPVNYNCPGQTVVAYTDGTPEALTTAVTAAGGRIMPLAVSGAFHSPCMDEAAAGLSDFLADFPLRPPDLPVYANLTAQPYGTRGRELLAAQVNHPVLWQATIHHMAMEGFDTFVEVGPGKTLSGLIRKILPQAVVFNVCDTATLETTIAGVKQTIC